MQRPTFLVLAALAAGLVALPAAGSAQTPSQAPAQTPAKQGPGRPGTMHGRRGADPVDRLLDRRADLKLTDAQVTKLKAIQTDYQKKDQPLVEQMRRDMGNRGARPDSAQRDSMRAHFRAERDSLAKLTPAQRQQAIAARQKAWETQHPDAAKAMRQLRDNRAAERKAIMAVLTPDQQQQLRDTAQQHRREGRQRGDSARAHGRAAPGGH